MRSSVSPIGELIEFENYLVFFGDRNSEFANVQREFPEMRFQRLRQTHGLKIFHSHERTVSENPESDAHWTQDSRLGLCINTADCIPLFLIDSRTSSIGAVHAGWRGVRDQITKFLILEMAEKCQTRPEDLTAFIGPHIQLSSFEVENKIRDSIIDTVKDSSGCSVAAATDKSWVDLNLIIQRQMTDMGISKTKIFCEKVDTKTESRYHSFRRDSIRAGRQLSFIAKR
jgi:YfiH family protein